MNSQVIFFIEHQLHVLGFKKDDYPNEQEVHLRFLKLLGILRLWFVGEPSQDFSARQILLAYKTLLDPSLDPRFTSIRESFKQTVIQELYVQQQTIITDREELQKLLESLEEKKRKLKGKKRELKDWEERLEERDREIEEIMSKKQEKIEKYQKVLEEEVTLKRSKVSIEFDEFRKQQEAWELKRKEQAERDRRAREEMEAELKRLRGELEKQREQLEKERLMLEIMVQETQSKIDEAIDEARAIAIRDETARIEAKLRASLIPIIRQELYDQVLVERKTVWEQEMRAILRKEIKTELEKDDTRKKQWELELRQTIIHEQRTKWELEFRARITQEIES